MLIITVLFANYVNNIDSVLKAVPPVAVLPTLYHVLVFRFLLITGSNTTHTLLRQI